MSIQTDQPAIQLRDETDTAALGAELATVLGSPPLVIFLSGALGAGKTTLARGLLRGLGYDGKVVSPTYTLMEPYEVAGNLILHVDLYRIADSEELEFLGLRDRLDDAVLLVEWPERGEGWLPQPDLTITLAPRGEGRDARIKVFSARGGEIARRIRPKPEH